MLAHVWKTMRPNDHVAFTRIQDLESNRDLSERFLVVAGQADIFLHIPVNDDHPAELARGSSIAALPAPVKVRLPNLFFRGLHPDLVILRSTAGHIQGPHILGPLSHYLSRSLVTAFLRGLSIKMAFAELLQSSMLGHDEAEAVCEDSLFELKLREGRCDVVASDIVAENFRSEYLFHSINHPTHVMVMKFAERIFSFVGLSFSKVNPEAIYPAMGIHQAWAIPQRLADRLGLTFSGWEFYRFGEVTMSPMEFTLRSYAAYCYRLEQLVASEFAKHLQGMEIRLGAAAEESASYREGLQVFRAIYRREPTQVGENRFMSGLLAGCAPSTIGAGI